MSCSSTSSGSGSGSEEDEGFDGYRKGGYHAVRIGDQFSAGRYIAQRKLGWGNFSTVWLAYDTKLKRLVALKIQKSAPEFAEAALHEIEFLSEITNRDPQNRKCILQLLDHFKHTGPNGQHLCLVFEFLGDSLLRLIRYNRYKGIGLNRVRQICKDILIGLDYLHRDLRMIHTDLKPENVLLISTIDPSKDPIRSNYKPVLERPAGNANGNPPQVNIIEKRLKERAKMALARISKQRPSMAEVSSKPFKKERNLDGIDLRCKIVDFGNACWEDRQFGDIIQTRQYRAPEVVIGAGYSFPADLWSFGCIAYELATGDVVFDPKEGHGFSEDEDHLALMMELLGKMPKKVAISGSRSKDYFDRHGDLKRIRRLRHWPLEKILIDKYKFTDLDAREFAAFLYPLLDFDPSKRPTASQCLSHPWFQTLEITKEKENITKEKENIGKEKDNIIKEKENIIKEKEHIKSGNTSGAKRSKEHESLAITRTNSSNNRSKSEIIPSSSGSKSNNKVHNKIENEKDKEKGKNEKIGGECENMATVKRVASRFNEKINQSIISKNNTHKLNHSASTRHSSITNNHPLINNYTQNTLPNNPPIHNTTNNYPPIHNSPQNTTQNIPPVYNTTNNPNNTTNSNDENNANNNEEPVGRVAIAMSKLGMSGRINSRRHYG